MLRSAGTIHVLKVTALCEACKRLLRVRRKWNSCAVPLASPKRLLRHGKHTIAKLCVAGAFGVGHILEARNPAFLAYGRLILDGNMTLRSIHLVDRKSVVAEVDRGQWCLRPMLGAVAHTPTRGRPMTAFSGGAPLAPL